MLGETMRFLIVVVCVFGFDAFAYAADAKLRYSGYSLLRVIPTTDEQLEYLVKLSEREDSGLDFWHLPSQLFHPVDLMVSGDKKNRILRLLEEKAIPQSLIIEDVQNIIQQTKPTEESIQFYSTDHFFTEYRRLHQIHHLMNVLANGHHEISTVVSIGNSSEGRNLTTVKIGKSKENGEKPVIWIMGGIHAREWISPATATYIVTKLLEENDEQVKQLVEDFDWYLLPVANPDGYEYSHTHDRLWRKTRSQTNSLFGCRGVDANRNFDIHWREIGSSVLPCSQIYAGRNAASEPEVKAIQDLLVSMKGRVKVFVDLHSYSQLFLTPYGWSFRFPPDYDAMISAGDAAIKSLEAVHGTRYEIGTTAQTLYGVSGNSNDWAYEKLGVRYSYCIELRDRGRHGFLLPRNQILPTAEETWSAILELAKIARKEL